MGLLDGFDNIFDSAGGRLGLGLLAAGSARADGAGAGQRLAEAIGSVDQWKQQQALAKRQAMQDQFMQFQMEQAKAQAERQAKIQAGMGQFFKPGQQALAPLMGDAETGILPSPGKPAVAPSFDAGGAAQFLATQGEYEKAIPLLQSLQPKREKLSQGEAVFENGKKVFENPKEPDLPNAVKEFNFGQANPAFNAWLLAQKKAGATNVSLSNVGPKAFETELGKMDAEQLGEWRKGAINAQNTLGVAKRMEEADAKGAYSGGAANLKMTVGSFINGITGATPKGQVDSELYNSEAKKLVLDSIKGLGANPSNADREFIEQTVPQLSTNAEARRKMTQFMKEKAQQSIDLYQRANAHARKNSGLGGFNIVEPTSDIDALVNKYAPTGR